MQPTITKTTADRIKSFLKPAVDTGAIPRDEYEAFVNALRGLTAAGQAEGPAGTQPPSGLLTLAQAAERLSCSKKTVSRMIEGGRLNAVYLTPGANKSLRIRDRELTALCDCKKNES